VRRWSLTSGACHSRRPFNNYVIHAVSVGRADPSGRGTRGLSPPCPGHDQASGGLAPAPREGVHGIDLSASEQRSPTGTSRALRRAGRWPLSVLYDGELHPSGRVIDTELGDGIAACSTLTLSTTMGSADLCGPCVVVDGCGDSVYADLARQDGNH